MKVELPGVSWPRWPKPRLTKGPGRRMLLAGLEGLCEGDSESPALALACTRQCTLCCLRLRGSEQRIDAFGHRPSRPARTQNAPACRRVGDGPAEARQPRRAASIAAISIFVMSIIASNA